LSCSSSNTSASDHQLTINNKIDNSTNGRSLLERIDSSTPSTSIVVTDSDHQLTASITNGSSSSSSNSDHYNGGNTIISEEMKRAAARKLIERYFFQLTDGCGNPKCNNKYCYSSGEVEKLNPDQAAARALTLFLQDAKLCDSHPSKLAKTTYNSLDSDTISSSSSSENNPNGRYFQCT